MGSSIDIVHGILRELDLRNRIAGGYPVSLHIKSGAYSRSLSTPSIAYLSGKIGGNIPRHLRLFEDTRVVVFGQL